MDELNHAATIYYPVTLGPVLLLLLAPLTRRSFRTAFSTVLLLGVAALAVVAVVHAGTRAQLDVVTAFLRGADRQPFLYVTEVVDAPGWLWPLAAGFGLLVPGLALWLRRGNEPRSPSPWLYGSMLGLWVLFVRLLLEKAAAPRELVWATGMSPALLLMSPFLGGYAGARGLRFGGLVAAFVGMAIVQRGVLIGVSYLATTQGLGTHLDVGVLEDINPPGFGTIVFAEGDDHDRWLRAIAILQAAIWVPITVVQGVVLGLVPYWIARKRRPE